MRAVALGTLHAKLDEYVHLAQEGETVLVTESDQVIARLVPPAENRDLAPGPETLTDAVQKGWITLPARNSPQGPPQRIPTAPWHELSRELDEDRSER